MIMKLYCNVIDRAMERSYPGSEAEEEIWTVNVSAVLTQLAELRQGTNTKDILVVETDQLFSRLLSYSPSAAAALLFSLSNASDFSQFRYPPVIHHHAMQNLIYGAESVIKHGWRPVCRTPTGSTPALPPFSIFRFSIGILQIGPNRTPLEVLHYCDRGLIDLQQMISTTFLEAHENLGNGTPEGQAVSCARELLECLQHRAPTLVDRGFAETLDNLYQQANELGPP